MKILAGAYRKDAGIIYIDSSKVEFNHPKHARELGIAIIYQELSILPHLSVSENIFLGRIPRRQRIAGSLIGMSATNGAGSCLIGSG